MDVVIWRVVDEDEGVVWTGLLTELDPAIDVIVVVDVEPTAEVVFIAYGALDEIVIEDEPDTGTLVGVELELE